MAIGIIVIVLFGGITFFTIKRIRGGDEFKFAFLIHLKPTEIVKQQKEAFDNLNEDDYLTYFANALTSLMFVEYVNGQRENGDPDEQGSGTEEQEQLA